MLRECFFTRLNDSLEHATAGVSTANKLTDINKFERVSERKILFSNFHSSLCCEFLQKKRRKMYEIKKKIQTTLAWEATGKWVYFEKQ